MGTLARRAWLGRASGLPSQFLVDDVGETWKAGPATTGGRRGFAELLLDFIERFALLHQIDHLSAARFHCVVALLDIGFRVQIAVSGYEGIGIEGEHGRYGFKPALR